MTPRPSVRLVLADVDGTLVTPDKELTTAAVDAVHRLHEHGIHFAVTSGRPPRGMAMLVEPLALRTPIAAFNGGTIVDADMSVVEQRTVAADLVTPVAHLMEQFHLDVWLYRGADWLVRDPDAPHVAREAATVRFEPTVMDGIEPLADHVAKLVGVSDDHEAVGRATVAARERFGDRVAASASQPYYLDVTHPDANKGTVATFFSRRFEVAPEEIATIGDMPNDVAMFARSGLSIAMGNASPEVQQAARKVTTSNEEDGFARAVRRFVLGEDPEA